MIDQTTIGELAAALKRVLMRHAESWDDQWHSELRVDPDADDGMDPARNPDKIYVDTVLDLPELARDLIAELGWKISGGLSP